MTMASDDTNPQVSLQRAIDAAVRAGDGWATVGRIARELRLNEETVERCAEKLQHDGQINAVDLGRATLLVRPEVNRRNAVARYYDVREREHNAEQARRQWGER